MGCDIHCAAERRVDGKWQLASPRVPKHKLYPWLKPDDEEYSEPVIEQPYDHRNYDLFAILANVRNNFNFKPIDEPRDLPDDLCDALREFNNGGGFGDHSFSWFTLQEILEFDWTQTVQQSGWVDPLVFEHWQRRQEWEPEPKEWAQSVSGGAVRHVSAETMAAAIEQMHKKCQAPTAGHSFDFDRFHKIELPKISNWRAEVKWKQRYARCCKDFWSETIPLLLRYGDPPDVRFVFGLDN